MRFLDGNGREISIGDVLQHPNGLEMTYVRYDTVLSRLVLRRRGISRMISSAEVLDWQKVPSCKNRSDADEVDRICRALSRKRSQRV